MYKNLTLNEHSSVMNVIRAHLKDSEYKANIEEECKKMKCGMDYVYYSYLELDKEMKYLLQTRNINNDINLEEIKQRLFYIKKVLYRIKNKHIENYKKIKVLKENDKRHNMAIDMIVFSMYRYPMFRHRVANIYSIDKTTRKEYTEKLLCLKHKMDILDGGLEYFLCEFKGMFKVLTDFYYLKDMIVIDRD